MLDEGEGLDQDIIRGQEVRGAAQQVRLDGAGLGMEPIVGIQQREQRGGVQEHAHCR
jgi:hypothetical protein